MNRLMENTVFSGFVMPCRFATWPTRISLSFVKPTTDGVSLLPSWFAMTVGFPPSTTATTLFVVPRSIPITFGMILCLQSSELSRPSPHRGRRGPRPPPPHVPELQHVDLDLARLELLGLRELDREHAVAICRLDLVALHRERQLHAALEADRK